MKQAKVLTPDELKRLLAVIESKRHSERNRCAFMLSYYGGMRVSEIAQLNFEDVIDPDCQVRDRIALKSAITKGGHARLVFVGSKLRKELERYVKSRGPKPRQSDPLLLTQKRRPFSPNTLCQLFTQLYNEAGIYGATSHSGRRTFITRLAHSGVSPKVIMTLAGHKQLSTTQRYIDVNDEMMKQAVEIL